MISHWNQRGSTISKRNWNQKYCHWFFVCFLLLQCCGLCFHFYSLCLKKLQSGLLFVVLASVSFVLLCTDDFFFSQKFTVLFTHADQLLSFVYFIVVFFNYKSVAVCKINVHDYRTGKNSWFRTIHVTLSIFICAIKPLSHVISLSFCTKIPFFAALRANCYCSPVQKKKPG